MEEPELVLVTDLARTVRALTGECIKTIKTKLKVQYDLAVLPWTVGGWERVTRAEATRVLREVARSLNLPEDYQW